MSNLLFSVFPNENFVDIGLYQYGWEQCEPSHSFGPAARNHYIFHYVISGTGTLMGYRLYRFFLFLTNSIASFRISACASRIIAR